MKNIKILAVCLCAFLLSACQTTNASDINKSTVIKRYSTVASWYQSGNKTASGQRFDPNGMTVAHRTLPFGAKLKLTNPNNGRSTVATVTDRGPLVRGTGLDVTRGIANKLNFKHLGKTTLLVEVMR